MSEWQIIAIVIGATATLGTLIVVVATFVHTSRRDYIKQLEQENEILRKQHKKED